MKKGCILVLMIHAILIASAAEQAQGPQQTLNRYIADQQGDPNDFALCEKIIRHMQAIRQKDQYRGFIHIVPAR